MQANFINIQTIEQLDALFEKSHTEPVVLLKHSNSCGISSDIYEQMREIDGDVNVIVIQKYRPISDAIAVKTGHRHQSPQAFIIKDGKPVYHATHYGIDPKKINKILES